MSERALLTTVLALACGGTDACFWHKKPQATIQTPPVPQQAPPHPASSKKKAGSTVKTAHPARHSKTKTASRPQKPPAPATVVGPPPPANPIGPPPPPPVNPAPLGQMLTPDERADLSRALDQSLSAARQNLSEASTQPLSPQQAETVNLVRAFVSQAERARETDLTTAAQLARRAEVLARSLVAGH